MVSCHKTMLLIFIVREFQIFHMFNVQFFLKALGVGVVSIAFL